MALRIRPPRTGHPQEAEKRKVSVVRRIRPNSCLDDGVKFSDLDWLDHARKALEQVRQTKRQRISTSSSQSTVKSISSLGDMEEASAQPKRRCTTHTSNPIGRRIKASRRAHMMYAAAVERNAYLDMSRGSADTVKTIL